MKYSPKELKFIVERIDKQTYELSEWEESFFNSVAKLVRADKTLSTKQEEILSRIWEKLEDV